MTSGNATSSELRTRRTYLLRLALRSIWSLPSAVSAALEALNDIGFFVTFQQETDLLGWHCPYLRQFCAEKSRLRLAWFRRSCTTDPCDFYGC